MKQGAGCPGPLQGVSCKLLHLSNLLKTNACSFQNHNFKEIQTAKANDNTELLSKIPMWTLCAFYPNCWPPHPWASWSLQIIIIVEHRLPSAVHFWMCTHKYPLKQPSHCLRRQINHCQNAIFLACKFEVSGSPWKTEYKNRSPKALHIHFPSYITLLKGLNYLSTCSFGPPQTRAGRAVGPW